MNKRALGLVIVFLLFLSELRGQIFDQVGENDALQCSQEFNFNKDGEGNFYKIVKLDKESDIIDSIYLLKIRPTGDTAWKVRTTAHNTWQLAVGKDGSSYLAATEDFYLTPFFSKYNKDGILVWKKYGKAMKDYPGFISLLQLKTDSIGNLYVRGSISGGFIFGETLSIKTKTGGIEQENVFILKIDSDGNFKWGKIPQSDYKGYSTTLSAYHIDKYQNVYLYAAYSTTTDLEGQKIFPITNGKGRSYFLAKYNSSGLLKWVSIAGADFSTSEIGQICTDDSNNVFINGKFVMEENISGVFGGNVLGPFNTGGDEILSSHPFSARINQSRGPGILYRINCGGPELQASPINWQEDTQDKPCPYFYYTTANHTTGTFYQWNRENNTDAPKDVFGPQRYLISWGTRLEYDFPITPGLYRVNLYFAEKPEDSGHAVGARVFDVQIGDQTVLEDFDIFATSGLNANKQSVLLYVESSMLELKFKRKVGNPQINGIEIATLNFDGSVLSSVDNPSSQSSEGKAGYVYIMNESLYINTKNNDEGFVPVEIYDYTGKTFYKQEVFAKTGIIEIPYQSMSAKPTSGLFLVKVDGRTYKFIGQ
ncbi:MAG: hypothetical protein J7604_01740 [Sporocytophaga sp.]|uniref:malectin domain-containing carbohydrate-binding protein n=1 Tax=Sporocytophaga sp. TaxID=2231183 RepID=UPI001B1BC45E|nr:malectin domain-containing carbohydrate-binding protein [Sporocytophaga sp.]MBO9698896.1 hypothetical protein [Sporocytophaga sp.]